MIIPFTASSMATSTIPSTAFSTTPTTTQVPSECNTDKMALVISYNISPSIELLLLDLINFVVTFGRQVECNIPYNIAGNLQCSILWKPVFKGFAV